MKLNRLMFWTFLPLALPQALYVKKTAPRFPAAMGARTGFVGQGQKLTLLAFGDSIIDGVGAQTMQNSLVGQIALQLSKKLQCEVRWSAIGKTGSNTNDMLADWDNRLLPDPADIILLSCGVNDVTSLLGSKKWQSNLMLLISQLKTHSPESIILMCGVPPLKQFPLLPQPLRSLLGIRSEYFDRLAINVTNELKDVHYIPITFDLTAEQFSEDGYHPSEQSYQDMADFFTAEFISGKHGSLLKEKISSDTRG